MSGAQLSFDDHPAIVLDNGSGTCRAGLAGDETPSSLFPSIVGRRKFLLESVDEAYVGNDAQQRRELLHLSHPIEHGIVVNWDDMEKIWDHTFFSDLKLPPEEHPILTSEPPLNPKGNREKMAQVLFETYKTPAAFVALQPMLAKHATGLHQGLMLSVGDGCLHCCPIFMGQVQFQAIRRIDFAGRDLTQYLQRLLFRRGYSFTTSAELDIVRDIKEKFCFVAESDNSYTSLASLQQRYTLPDGSTVKLDHERYLCSELLFKPDGEFHTGKGLVDLIVDCVNDCNVEARKDLYHMISLSGGTTLLPGFKERLRKELRALPPKKYPGMNIWNSPERQFHVWIGGSITASLSSMEHAWVLFETYKAPAIFMAYQPLLSLLAAFQYQGIVVSVGDGVSYVVPICETQSQLHSVRRVDLGGRDLTLQLQQLLYKRGYSFTSSCELDIVRDMKEKLCFVARDRSHFKKLSTPMASKCEGSYKLPDGSVIKLDHERYKCPEMLFEPEDDSQEYKGLAGLIEESINSLDISCRKDMYMCVIVAGGTTFLPGFTERLQKELLCASPPGVHHVKLIARQERGHYEWLGGSIMASLSVYQQVFISKKEYEELGPSLVCRKHFF